MKRRFLFMLMAALTCIGANAAIKRANNYLEASEAKATAGKTVVVNILMTNNLNIVNWQTNLVLPEGITLVSAEAAEKWVDPVNVEGNKISAETETPVGSSQKAVIAKVTLQVASTVAAGEYEIALHGTVMIDENSDIVTQVDDKVAKLTVEENPGLKGDVNGDNAVDVMDAVMIYDIMAGNVASKPEADVNGDNAVDVMDVVAIYDIMAGN
ncbi:MAG: dockerin type I repeat-containing protein [Bacteroidaceae bacterium]|nr:dockerin type I repeat-containing protein [Bacteroidaceae bacterium]